MAMVRFEDVATRVNTREDRFNTALTYYVGGEHIETGELKVAGRGVIKEADLGPMFYFGFKPGDILFVTRNPHLRKCAMVEFPGICSEKTLVIATKDRHDGGDYHREILWLSLLVEVIQLQRAADEQHDAARLADEAHDLRREDDAHERQRELADLIWAATGLKEAYKKAIIATDEMLKAKFEIMFGKYKNTVAFQNICICGPQNGYYRKGAERDGSIPVLKMTQLFSHESMEYVSRSECDAWALNQDDLGKFRVTPSDLLFGRRSLVPEGAGKCCRAGNIKCDFIFESSIIRVTLNPELALPQYVQAWFGSVEGEATMSKMRSGTTVFGIKGSALKTMKLPLPPLSHQRTFVEISEKADAAKAALKKSIAHLAFIQICRTLAK